MQGVQRSGPLRHFGALSGQQYKIGLFKNTKIKGKKIGFGDFWKKPHLVASKSLTSYSLSLVSYQMWFCPKIAQKQKQKKNGSYGFRRYQMLIPQKSPNLHYFTVIFGVFEQFLVKPHLVTLCRQGTKISEGHLYLFAMYTRVYFFYDFFVRSGG